MKKLMAILILLLLAGCAKAAPAVEAAPQAEATSLPAVTAAPVTAAPTAMPEQGISIVASVTATPKPMESPIPSPEPTAAPTPEPTSTPAPTPTPGPLAGIIIGVDPGHQLVYDPKPEPVAPGSKETKQRVAGGCKGIRSGVFEYEVNLAVGLHLRDLLEKAGATVIMTHEVLDVNISNIERAQLFNEANVDLGIRLHCNKAGNQKTRGAFMLVPTENRTDFFDQNVRAAQAIIDAYCAETGIPLRYKEGITYRGDQTGFNWCTRPIVNIEMGHLSNPEEDALMSDPDFQRRMAQGLFNGILQYFRPDPSDNP